MEKVKMSREQFGKSLKNHDWYYQYSDDSRSYRRGQDQRHQLSKMHTSLDCPFAMTELRKWAHNMIVDRFLEEEPGQWYPNPRKYKCIAACSRDDLMTRAEHDEISQWMILDGTIAGIENLI